MVEAADCGAEVIGPFAGRGIPDFGVVRLSCNVALILGPRPLLPPVNRTVPSARSVRFDQERFEPTLPACAKVGVGPLISMIHALPSLSIVRILSGENMAAGSYGSDTNGVCPRFVTEPRPATLIVKIVPPLFPPR